MTWRLGQKKVWSFYTAWHVGTLDHKMYSNALNIPWISSFIKYNEMFHFPKANKHTLLNTPANPCWFAVC